MEQGSEKTQSNSDKIWQRSEKTSMMKRIMRGDQILREHRHNTLFQQGKAGWKFSQFTVKGKRKTTIKNNSALRMSNIFHQLLSHELIFKVC